MTANADYGAHLMPESCRRMGDELLSWRCQRCGRWVNEFGPIDTSRCAPNDGSRA